MWDFSIGRACVGAVLRTTPFIMLRMAIYLGIGDGLSARGAASAPVIGFGLLGHFWSDVRRAIMEPALSGAG